MEAPARINIHADRWVACIRELAFVGFDFAGATFLAHIRALPDAPGAPLIALSLVGTNPAEQGVAIVYAGTDTIANHITAGRLVEVPAGYEAADSVALSLLRIRIEEPAMEALPQPNEIGDDITLAWDLHITPLGGTKDKYCGGAFVVRSGVTQ